MNNCFADDFEDDFGPAAGANVDKPAAASPVLGYAQKCAKCGGTGRFSSYSGRVLGECFACKGSGTMTFKSSPEQRAKNRAQAADRRDTYAERVAAEFAAQHPAEWEWINSRAVRGNSFAISLQGGIAKFGSLTPNQLAAVSRMAEKDAASAADRADAVANAKAVDMAKIEEAFAKAHSAIKSPKLRIGSLVISHAKATSANPGALYVKSKGNFETSVYFGKIMGGKFIKSRDCDAATEAQIIEAANDPLAAAIAYGRRTGECAICGRSLTNHASIDRGIGPICANKFGWGA